MIIKAILKMLIAIGNAAASTLPLHTPIEFPDTGPFAAIFAGLGAMNRFVDVRVLLLVVGIILAFEFALLLYQVYRAVLGFIPALK
jgi:hypothetical protein